MRNVIDAPEACRCDDGQSIRRGICQTCFCEVAMPDLSAALCDHAMADHFPTPVPLWRLAMRFAGIWLALGLGLSALIWALSLIA